MNLRDYQKRGIQLIKQAMIDSRREGKPSNTLLAAPCAYGKTITAAYLLKAYQDAGKRGIFICDRVKLVNQSIAAFGKLGLNFGVIQSFHELYDAKKPIQIASAQSLENMREWPHADFVIVDECFKGDVELLTEKGWVRFDRLGDEQIAQYDGETRGISFAKPLRKIKKPYNGKMVKFYSEKLMNLTMTEGHELIQFRKDGSYRKIKAKDCKFNHLWENRTAGYSVIKGGKLTPIQRLCIAYQADGSKHGNTKAAFQFSKKRKIDRFIDICSDGDISWNETKPIPCVNNTKERRRFFVSNSGLTKDIASLFDLSKIGLDLAREIIEEMVCWDGHKHSDNSYYFSSVDESAVDFYQAVCALAGYKTNKTIQVDHRKDSYSDVHRLFISKNVEGFKAQGMDKETYHYKGEVYCVTVETGNILVRSGGKVTVIGNCHSLRKSIRDKMASWTKVPFLGLSATPYSKGLGNYFSKLVVPIEPRQLLEQGYLCPVDYYGGRKASLKGVKTKKLSTGGSDYLDSSLQEAIENDKKLAGDIVKNWIKRANGRMTIAFSPSVKHSKHLVDLFNDAGIPAVHIDGYMTSEQQADIYEGHRQGDFLILSCSRLLNTGYDEPKVSCLIDCYPTKSIIQYVQRAGRPMRTAEGKENAIYLDHAGNVSRHGFAEDIVPEELDDETKEYNERKLTKDKKEPNIKQCPQCYQEMAGIRCNKCGYEVPIKEQIETDNQELEQLLSVDAKAWHKKTTREDKEKFYGMLKYYERQKGYKAGWAAHRFRERSGVWPNSYKSAPPQAPNKEFMGYIKHLAIKRRCAA